MSTAGQHLRKAQTQYRQDFNARLCRATNHVSPASLIFVEATSAIQSHILSLVASGLFPVVAVNSYTLIMQRCASLAEKMFFSCAAKTTDPCPDHISDLTHAFCDHSRILSLHALLRPRTFASHSSALKEAGTGGTPANFDDASTPLHDTEYYRALS